MWFFNPTQGSWSHEQFMIKPHTVFEGGFAATVVVVPFEKKRKKGKDEEDTALSFVPMGVRIEDMRIYNKYDKFQLPGYSYFFKTSTGKISETSEWRFRCHNGGRPYMMGGFPEILKPTTKHAGIPLDEHKRAELFGKLIESAKLSYEMYRQELRAAA